MTPLEQKRHFDSVVERIEKARISVSEHHIVNIVAISKYSTSKEIEALYNIGQRAFGENKVQDLKIKADELSKLPISWHFVGRLQKNKINQLIALRPRLIHSIDSLELATALNARLQSAGLQQKVLLQINSANEPSKAGFSVNEAKESYLQIMQECPHLQLKGVMSIGAHTEDKKRIEESFVLTRKIFDTLPDATICSMGMSNDFELAIASGSNLVRLGSILFK